MITNDVYALSLEQTGRIVCSLWYIWLYMLLFLNLRLHPWVWLSDGHPTEFSKWWFQASWHVCIGQMCLARALWVALLSYVLLCQDAPGDVYNCGYSVHHSNISVGQQSNINYNIVLPLCLWRPVKQLKHYKSAEVTAVEDRERRVPAERIRDQYSELWLCGRVVINQRCLQRVF